MDAFAAFDLTKAYGENTALRGVNLQVPEGGSMACVGPEGAGKTTLARLMAGLGRPSSGGCSVLGLSPAHESARLHGMMGAVLYSAKLYGSMSLWDNMRFFAGAHYVPKDQGIERASFLLHRLNIWDERDKHPGQLPTGVLKRAGLARALIHRPKVLLLDEQGAGMDLETAEMVRGLLRYVIQEEGVSLLFCTKNMNYAPGVCNSFALLDRGALMARGSMEALRVGGGVRLRAALRLAEGQPGPTGFYQQEGLWQREIQAEEEMPRLIAQAVAAGGSLYEARVIRPSLEEIYAAYLAGGRRREAFHGTTGETRTGPAGAEPPAGSPEGGENQAVFLGGTAAGEEGPGDHLG
ncbi:ABC transporter ATP-binding protein [Acutalibacter caecimuris]|uniref:ABC transporter ATP-binding protein n=1 Tax=Acutalibacter caecimuris TaxID=3093657 RepID=UPI002AC975B1|nr:ABC transporter ATP-binding protein [Acutalibacter sp. M00118]